MSWEGRQKAAVDADRPLKRLADAAADENRRTLDNSLNARSCCTAALVLAETTATALVSAVSEQTRENAANARQN